MRTVPRPSEIVTATCIVFGIGTETFVGCRRSKVAVLAREVCGTVLRRAGLSYPECAVAMERPNHSSVVTACQRAAAGFDKPVPFIHGEPTTRNLCDRVWAAALGGNCETVSHVHIFYSMQPRPPKRPLVRTTGTAADRWARGEVA